MRPNPIAHYVLAGWRDAAIHRLHFNARLFGGLPDVAATGFARSFITPCTDAMWGVRRLASRAAATYPL